MKRPVSRKRSQKGFTLAEMSLVLAIIGLLLVSISTGQELIDQAKTKKMVNDLYFIESQFQLYQQRKGRLPGDCDADGIIDYDAGATTRLDIDINDRALAYSQSVLLPTIPVDGADASEETDGCALTGDAGGAVYSVTTNTTNANIWINDMKLAGLMSDSASNRQYARRIQEDFIFLGHVTDDAGYSADGADYNALVMHGVPQSLAVRMANAINGQDARADRSRLRRLNPTDATGLGVYSTTWQIDGAETDPQMRDAKVTVVYFFDRIPETQEGGVVAAP